MWRGSKRNKKILKCILLHSFPFPPSPLLISKNGIPSPQASVSGEPLAFGSFWSSSLKVTNTAK